MEKSQAILRMAVAIFAVGILGFVVTLVLPKMNKPKSQQHEDLQKLKQSLNQTFKKNKALALEIEEFRNRQLRELEATEEREARISFLQSKNKEYMEFVQKLTKENVEGSPFLQFLYGKIKIFESKIRRGNAQIEEMLSEGKAAGADNQSAAISEPLTQEGDDGSVTTSEPKLDGQVDEEVFRESLTRLVDQLDDEVASFSIRMPAVSSRLKEESVQREALKSQVEDLKEKMEAMNSTTIEKQKQIKQIEEVNKTLEKKIANAQQNESELIAQKTQEIAALKQRLEEVEIKLEIKASESKLVGNVLEQRKIQEIELLTKQLQEAKELATSLQNQKELEVRELRQKVEAAQESVNALGGANEKEIERLRNELKDSFAEIELMKVAHAKALSPVSGKLALATREVQNLQGVTKGQENRSLDSDQVKFKGIPEGRSEEKQNSWTNLERGMVFEGFNRPVMRTDAKEKLMASSILDSYGEPMSAEDMKMLDMDFTGDKKATKELHKQIDRLQRENETLVEKFELSQAARKKDRITFFYNLGLSYVYAGLFREAEESFKKGLEIEPEDADLHYNLAVLYQDHLSEKEQGLDHYEMFLKYSTDQDKRRDVRTWMDFSQRGFGMGRENRRESATRAFKQLMFTNSK